MRLPGLGNDLLNTDAPRWYRRTQNFMTAVKNGNFAQTYQHYQPGVTVMWLNAIPRYLNIKYQQSYSSEVKTLEHSGYFPTIHKISKGTLVFVLFFVFLYQLFLIKSLFGSSVAYLYGFFTAIEPYFVGIDRYFHLTSLETYFIFTSFLLLLLWNEKKISYFSLISGVFFALSALSKITTIAVFPIFFYVYIFPFLRSKNYIDLKPLIYFSLSALLTFILVFPAMWVTPVEVVLKLYRAIFTAINEDSTITSSSPLLNLFFYDLVLFYKMSPITYLIFVFSIFKLPFTSMFKQLKWVLVLIIFYWLVLTLSVKKIDRYAIVMFPFILLLASSYVSILRISYQKLLIGLCLIYTGVVVYFYYPVYSSYYSFLFGGTNVALTLGIYDNSGEYYAQAAKYLNTKDRNTQILVPYNTDTFKYFSSGITLFAPTRNVDYIVTSIEHVNDVPIGFCVQENSFGNTTPIVFVYKCN